MNKYLKNLGLTHPYYTDTFFTIFKKRHCRSVRLEIFQRGELSFWKFIQLLLQDVNMMKIFGNQSGHMMSTSRMKRI